MSERTPAHVNERGGRDGMVAAVGDLFDLSGHVALVTGGNSGIGLGMADGLAAHGADVAIWGTNPDKNEAAADQLERHGTKVLSLICDVGDEAAVEASFAETIGTLGKVDSCFANAGVGGNGSAFVPLTSAGLHAVEPRHAGAASGLVNVAQQLGGSLGLAVLVTVFGRASQRAAETADAGAVHAGMSTHMFVAGADAAFMASAVLLAATVVVVGLLLRSRPPARSIG